MERPRRFSQHDLSTLATDFAPDEVEQTSLRAVVEVQEEELEGLDATIACLEVRLRELHAQRDSVRLLYNVNRGLLAPVRRLPPETLGEVFLNCLSVPSAPPSLREAPLLLLRVCRRWRRIAAGTPRLWVDLLLNYRLRMDPCPVIPTWLSNSGTLSINMNISPGCWPLQSDRGGAMQLIFQNFHRFRRVECLVDEYFRAELLRQNGPIHATSLKSFRPLPSGLPPPRDLRLKDCIRAPHLTAIHLEYMSMVNLVSFNPMNLSSVTLEPYHSEMLQAFNFLRSCPNISFLCFILGGQFEPNMDGRSQILFPSLGILIVEFGVGCDPCPFLRAIQAPALLDLQLIAQESLGDWTLPFLPTALDTLLGHEHPPLQRLSLDSVEIEDPILFMSTLRRLRDLRSITLTNGAVDDSILEALARDSSSPPSLWIGPQLSMVDVSGSYFSRGLFLKLVRSRAPTNVNIITNHGAHLLYVQVGCPIGKADEEFLAMLKEISQSCGNHLKINEPVVRCSSGGPRS